MESLEVSAKTVEEAIDLALKQLDVSRDEIEITVLSKGKSGILGLGAEEAKIRVTRLDHSAAEDKDVALLAKEVVEKFLKYMRMSASVSMREPAAETGSEGEVKPVIDIAGEDLGILIGRRGDTLASMQYLVNLIIGRKLKAKTTVMLDVEGYRTRRQESLKALALRMAERVKATGRPVALEPMPPAERRIVHVALAENPDVVTQSSGNGETRKVSIYLRRR